MENELRELLAKIEGKADAESNWFVRGEMNACIAEVKAAVFPNGLYCGDEAAKEQYAIAHKAIESRKNGLFNDWQELRNRAYACHMDGDTEGFAQYNLASMASMNAHVRVNEFLVQLDCTMGYTCEGVFAEAMLQAWSVCYKGSDRFSEKTQEYLDGKLNEIAEHFGIVLE